MIPAADSPRAVARHRSPFRGSDTWLLAGICLLLRIVSLFRFCLSDDEAIYAVVAREMLSGQVLYRDVVDHKPPFIYVVYAATQAIGGPSGGMLLLHLFTIGVVLATALLLGRIVREFAGDGEHPRAPFFASLLYLVFTTTLLPFDSLAANCELYMMLPLSASTLLFLRGAARARLPILAGSGALVAFAVFCKYQGGIQLALYAGYLLVIHRRDLGRAMRAGLALGAGFLLALGMGVGILYVTGAWESAWFWFRFNSSYIKAGFRLVDTLKRAAVRVSFVGGSALFLWILGFAAALRSLRPRASSGTVAFARFAAGWLLVSALATTTGGRFFGHYFHQVTAPLAVLAASAAARIRDSRRGLFLLAVAGPAAIFLAITIFYNQVVAAAGEPEPDYAGMTNVIQRHAGPGDRVVIWGNLPVLYFTVERPLGTRFVFSNYMTGLSPATPTQSDPTVDASPNIVPRSWDMFEADMAARKPKVFVDTSPGNVAAYGKFPLSRFPRLCDVIAREFVPVADYAGIRVYSRAASPRPVDPGTPALCAPDPRR